MRRWKWFLVTGVVVLIGILGIYLADTSSPAEDQSRVYFSIPANKEVNSDTIRAAFVRLVPLGSSESAVSEFVDRSAIGKDGLSKYYPRENGKAAIRIGLGARSSNLVNREFAVVLQFDDAEKLRDVEVKTWLTGP